MAEETAKTEEKIDTLVIQYLKILDKKEDKKTKQESDIERKLYVQLEKFSNWLWKRKFSYVDWETKEEAFWFAMGKCLDVWKKDRTIKFYAAHYAVTLENAAKKYNKKDNDIFSHVPEKITKTVKVLMYYAEKKSDLLKDMGKTRECLISVFGYTEQETEAVLKYLKAKQILSLNVDEDEDEESLLVIEDNPQSPDGIANNTDNFISIMKIINTVYQQQADKAFLSKVITYKLLSIAEPTDMELMKSYSFIDKELVSNFFSGKFPKQNEISRSGGSVNKKWDQFIKKVLKRYGEELQTLWDLS